MMPPDVDASQHVPDLWRVYGRHAALMLGTGPAPAEDHRDGSFFALSGAPHVDLNQGAIFGPGGQADADAIAAAMRAAGVPLLLAVSASVGGSAGVVAALHRHGFDRATVGEALFHAPVVPPREDSPFEVRRVRSAADHDGVARVFAEAHGYAPALVAAMYGPALVDRPDVGGWLAWDGDDPVSGVFVTRVGRTLAFFDMMTSPRHRRRGAGRAVLTHALADAAAETDGSPSVTFWSTPMGRPLYESMGFSVVDDIDVWTHGASPEDMAAVGAG